MSNLMEFEIFIEETKRRVSASIGYERNLVVYPVVKNNGVVYQGLIILDPEVNISPSIYLNPYYNRYRNGVFMEDIVDDIIKIYKNNKPVKNFDISQLRNFENAKKKLVMRLVNTEKNIELLRDIPNRPFHDLSIIYNVVVSDFVDEYATILVYNQHLNLWGITEEELYGFAMENRHRVDSGGCPLCI